eukprot:3640421-Prymnesium_polylepis.1
MRNSTADRGSDGATRRRPRVMPPRFDRPPPPFCSSSGLAVWVAVRFFRIWNRFDSRRLKFALIRKLAAAQVLRLETVASD